MQQQIDDQIRKEYERRQKANPGKKFSRASVMRAVRTWAAGDETTPGALGKEYELPSSKMYRDIARVIGFKK